MPSSAVLYDPEAAAWLRFGSLIEEIEVLTPDQVVEKNGVLLTPPVRCGLLPGTYREFLVRRGVVREAVIGKDELTRSPRSYLVNAVRKWRKAELLPG
jgi:para-aminobenzoate synthetase/4-amino-4-deoxychorismate lyase